MSQKLNKQEVKQINQIELIVDEVENNSVIVNLDGWRKRVYFKEWAIKKIPNVGQKIVVQYTGDIKDIHSVVFEVIK